MVRTALLSAGVGIGLLALALGILMHKMTASCRTITVDDDKIKVLVETNQLLTTWDMEEKLDTSNSTFQLQQLVYVGKLVGLKNKRKLTPSNVVTYARV